MRFALCSDCVRPLERFGMLEVGFKLENPCPASLILAEKRVTNGV
jgi:hypothetical protein